MEHYKLINIHKKDFRNKVKKMMKELKNKSSKFKNNNKTKIQKLQRPMGEKKLFLRTNKMVNEMKQKIQELKTYIYYFIF